MLHLENKQLKNTSPVDKDECQLDIFSHFCLLWEVVAKSKTINLISNKKYFLLKIGKQAIEKELISNIYSIMS